MESVRLHIRFAVAPVLCFLMAAVGCDEPTPTGAISERMSESVPLLTGLAAELETLEEQRAPGGRKDTPWERMSDAELADAVAEADGKVMIGFKDSALVAGVTNSGIVVASAEARERGRALARSLGVKVRRELKYTPTIVATISPELVAALRRSPWVDYVEPSLTWDLFSSTSGPLVPRSALLSQTVPSNISQVKADSAWAIATGAGETLVIIDTGLDDNHPDLDPETHWRCDDQNLQLYDLHGHGTHVAGIAAALDNTSYVVGMAPDATVISANAADGNGNILPAEVACAIDMARDSLDRAVVNMSFGGSAQQAVTDQINGGYQYDDFIFVAAVGDQDATSIPHPANLATVLAVAAVDGSDNHFDDSNTGAEVDLAAPGVNILSTSLPSGDTNKCGGGSGQYTKTCTGTSMAAPHVAGAALLLREFFPGWPNLNIMGQLESTADDVEGTGFDYETGSGRINLLSALEVPELVADINGPDVVTEEDGCTWNAFYNGVPPFTYSWKRDGTPVGTSDEYTYDPVGSEPFTLVLTMWDNYSQMDADTLFVDIYGGGGSPPPPCQ